MSEMKTKGKHQRLQEYFETLDSKTLARALIVAVEDIEFGATDRVESLERIFYITKPGGATEPKEAGGK